MGLLVRFMATATEGLSLGIYLDLPAISSAMKSPGLCPCCWQTPEELHLSQKGRGFLPCKTVSPSGTNFEYQIGEFPRGHRSLQSRFWCYIWTWLSHFTPLLYISVLLLFLPCLAFVLVVLQSKRVTNQNRSTYLFGGVDGPGVQCTCNHHILYIDIHTYKYFILILYQIWCSIINLLYKAILRYLTIFGQTHLPEYPQYC